MRVLFWGTPEFAASALRALIGEGHDVVGVVTQPDRPQGRSRSRVVASPVKDVAVAEGIPVLQPEKPRGADFIAQLKALDPEIAVVVAYGRLLPQEVIDLPPRGTLNIHGSLLPKLRGASPIEGAILAGLDETGVSIMRMVLKLDAGPVLLREATPIGPDETSGDLRYRLAEMGAEALIETLSMIETNTAHEEPQNDADATFVKRITRDDTRVDWTTTAEQVSRVIRAYDPTPGACTAKAGIEVKLFGAREVGVTRADAADTADTIGAAAAAGATLTGTAAAHGTVLSINAEGMAVACGSGAVRVNAVHPSGRKRLSPRDWAAGRGVAVGDVLG